MARYSQRPENALKRANEFIEVGKPARALDTLQEVFRNKKWTYTWSESVLEPIMFKYLDLCVELKKSHIAKEGLFQYRNMFQSVNVGSLENVIRGYLRMAEEKTEAAKAQSAQAVIDIDDLDNLATPESILLSAVSGEDAQDRSDRTILTPWVKFLWESYCQCLELLRTNAHVETLYHDIARMAFQFCLSYNRKTEFRKLCDKLRKHLEDICKLPPQVANVSISKPETQQLNLDTRLYQLDSAIQMELWQEAYKAIEDIHGLMNMSKKMPVPKTMANYYQKLAMVFWKAGNQLFHAAALFKLFQLSKEMKKNITPEELQRMACRVLISTLAIPLPSAHPEFDRFIETDKTPLEKAQRLAVLLGLLQPPTRASLLKDIVRVNVVNLASPQLQDLYNWLEVEFHPLLLCTRVKTVIEGIQAEEGSPLQQYIPALQDVTLVRLIRQVAQVYQTIEFTRLLELAQFTNAFHLERILVDCVRHNDMQIRIDHGKFYLKKGAMEAGPNVTTGDLTGHECIHFGMDLSESQREDKPEGPTLQVMPSEQIRNQLVNMAGVLYRAIDTIYPNKKKTEREKLRANMVQHYHENKVKEHQRILQRHKIIEDRKEYIERLNTVREEEEMRRQEELQRQQMLAEQKRLEQEREERERKRQQNEIQQIKDRHLKEKMQQISQTSHGQKVLKKLDEDEIKKMDAEQIAAREAEELQKEKRELQAKLKSQEKKVDYFERAKRLEEIPLLQKNMEEKQVQDQKFWEQQEAERIAAAVEERRLAVANRERLQRMRPDKEEFLAKLKSERNIVYEDKLKDFEKLLEEERKKRLVQRKIARKEERRQKWIREKEQEAERKREEEKRREEEERKKKEDDERKEKEERLRAEREEQEKKEKDHLAMMERVAAKQRQREEEIERRLQEDREATREQTSSWRRGEANKPERREDRTERREDRTERREDRTERREEKPREDKPREEPSSWRKPGLTSSDDPPKKAEPWRASRLREADPKADTWRSSERDRGEERRFDREERRDRGGFDREESRGGREERREGGGRDREERGERIERGERQSGRDREERGERPVREERRGGERFGDRGGDRFGGGRDGGRDERGSSWRAKAAAGGADEEDRMRRAPLSRAPKGDTGSDWRSKDAPRRDEPPRRDEGPRRSEDRRAPPRSDKPRDQSAAEEDGTWQVANRRR